MRNLEHDQVHVRFNIPFITRIIFFNDQIFIDGHFVQLIPEGNDSVYDLCNYLTSIATFPYSAVYDEITGKIKLTGTDSTTRNIKFTEGFAKLTGFKFENRQISAGLSLTSFNTVSQSTGN